MSDRIQRVAAAAVEASARIAAVNEIAFTLRNYWKAESVKSEGAAGIAVAALLKGGESVAGQTVVVIICGGTVDHSTISAAMRSE